MTTTQSAVNDEIYILLVEAREKIVRDFDEAMRGAVHIPQVFGQALYDELVDRATKERDETLARLDERIHNRICQVAIEQLTK